jgi:hypothetical protein
MAVQSVMTSQTLSYKFPFSEFAFPTDLSFIVLAEGSKSAFLRVRILHIKHYDLSDKPYVDRSYHSTQKCY